MLASSSNSLVKKDFIWLMEFTFQRKYIENNQKRGYLNRNYLYTMETKAIA
jgi:hypothetical protein